MRSNVIMSINYNITHKKTLKYYIEFSPIFLVLDIRHFLLDEIPKYPDCIR